MLYYYESCQLLPILAFSLVTPLLSPYYTTSPLDLSHSVSSVLGGVICWLQDYCGPGSAARSSLWFWICWLKAHCGPGSYGYKLIFNRDLLTEVSLWFWIFVLCRAFRGLSELIYSLYSLNQLQLTRRSTSSQISWPGLRSSLGSADLKLTGVLDWLTWSLLWSCTCWPGV
jgi:hypothetical protein